MGQGVIYLFCRKAGIKFNYISNFELKKEIMELKMYFMHETF